MNTILSINKIVQKLIVITLVMFVPFHSIGAQTNGNQNALSGERLVFSTIVEEDLYHFHLPEISSIILDCIPREEDPSTIKNKSPHFELLNAAGRAVRPDVRDSQTWSSLYDHLSTGDYFIRFIGTDLPARINMTGYAVEEDDSNMGAGFSSAIDLGRYSSSFVCSDQYDASRHVSGSSLGEIGKEVIYSFILSEPMPVVITHWGSAVTQMLPTDMQGIYGSRIYLYRETPHSNGDHYTIDLLYDSFGMTASSGAPVSPLSAVFSESMLYHQAEASLSCDLPAGKYYLVSESPYKKSMADYFAYDGPIRTTVHGFLPDGYYATSPCELAVDDSASFEIEDAKASSKYDNGYINYAFQTTHEQDILIETTGNLVSLSDDGTLSGNRYERTGLPAGRHTLTIQGNGSDESIRIASASFSRKGQTSEDPIVVSFSQEEGLYNEALNLRYYSGAVYYSIHLGMNATLIDESHMQEGDAEPTLFRNGEEIMPTDTLSEKRMYANLQAGDYEYVIHGDRVGVLHVLLRTLSPGAKTLLPQGITLSDSQNYIATYTPITGAVANALVNNSTVDVTYYDGLGRPIQEVSCSSGPYGQDEADYWLYLQGELKEIWSKTPMGGNGQYKPLSRLRHASYMNNREDGYNYSEYEYEKTLLKRKTGETGPGKQWHSAGKAIKTRYWMNTAEGERSCRKLLVSNQISELRRPTANGNYQQGSLRIEETEDEAGNRLLRFLNHFGKPVLERAVVSAGEYVDTYYVYDDHRCLVVVVQPEGSALMPEGIMPGDLYEKYCWAYAYNGHMDRTVEKGPGTGIKRYVYNRDGYRVLSQDAVQHTRGEWLADIPDILGRPAIRLMVRDAGRFHPELLEDIHAVYDPSQDSTYQYCIVGLDQLDVEIQEVNYYDGYDFLLGFPASRSDALLFQEDGASDGIRGACSNITNKNLQTGVLQKDDETGELMLSTFWYDHYGRLTQTRSENILGGWSVYGEKHDFVGNTLLSQESHSDSLQREHSLLTKNTFDAKSRLMNSTVVADGDTLARETFGYDPSGRLEYIRTRTSGVDDELLMTYNIRNRLTERKDGVWGQKLTYDWNGMISQWDWQNGGESRRQQFSYDGLLRITQADELVGDSLASCYRYNYDRNGNMITQENSFSGVTDTFVYSGNHLASSSYDASGRTLFDADSGLSLEYNGRDLMRKVSHGDSILANYSYLSDGKKTRVVDGNGNGLLYVGSLIYRKSGQSIDLESMAWRGGRIVVRSGGQGSSCLVPLVFSTDHLGSVRAVRDGESGTVVEQNMYGPYGSRTEMGLGLSGNRYYFNGKEEQSIAGVPYVDYGARMYSPQLKRWLTPDPLGQKYYSISPYVFCAGNPVNYIDFEGKELGDWETVLFSLHHPYIAKQIGQVKHGSNNISTVTVRFATRGEILDGHRNSNRDERGSELGAFRHALWQAVITNRFGGRIAMSIGDAHEINPDKVDFNVRVYDNLDDADRAVDLMNNQIGRGIGDTGFVEDFNSMAKKTLEFFKTIGLYTANKDNNSNQWIIVRTQLDDNKAQQLKRIFDNLDNNGYYAIEKN